ncbi:MAG: deoxynucleoside kinase [archaeon]|nr:deoxynucleoside kinase [archaeon]
MTWYVIEGIDGSGKSTIGHMIEEKIIKCGRKVLFLEHPNDLCRFGRLAHKYLFKRGKMAVVFATLFYILNVVHSLKYKKKHSEEYDDFIFVRYNMAVAYLPKKLIKLGNKIIKYVFPAPDVGIFVDIDPELAMRRISERSEKLEMFESVEKLASTREKMLSLLDDWIIVNNNHDLEQTKKSINLLISEMTENLLS